MGKASSREVLSRKLREEEEEEGRGKEEADTKGDRAPPL